MMIKVTRAAESCGLLLQNMLKGVWRYQPKFWAHIEGLYRGYAESFSLWGEKKSGQSYKTANSIPKKGKRGSLAKGFVSICSFYIQLKFYEFTFQRSTCFPSQKSQSSFLSTHSHRDYMPELWCDYCWCFAFWRELCAHCRFSEGSHLASPS